MFYDNNTTVATSTCNSMMQKSSMESISAVTEGLFSSAVIELSADLETISSYSGRAWVHRVG